MTKEYYATYLNDECFNRGAFSSVEEAKQAIIEEYKNDLADGSYTADEFHIFSVGVAKPLREVAKEQIKHRAEWVVEHLCESLDDDWCFDEPSIPINEANIALMKDLLNQFYEKCEYGFNNVIDGIQEFKFSEVSHDAD